MRKARKGSLSPFCLLNNLAVASKRNKVLINDYGVRYSAFNSVYNARLLKNIISKLNPKQYEIQAISVDEYVEENKVKPDFIKIDAENSEYEILLGMGNTNKIPLIELLPQASRKISVLCLVGILFGFLVQHKLNHSTVNTITLNSMVIFPFSIIILISFWFHTMRKRLMGWGTDELLNRKAGE